MASMYFLSAVFVAVGYLFLLNLVLRYFDVSGSFVCFGNNPSHYESHMMILIFKLTQDIRD